MERKSSRCLRANLQETGGDTAMTEDANEQAIKASLEKERDDAIQLHDLLESESADHWRKKGDESRKQAEYGAAVKGGVKPDHRGGVKVDQRRG